MTHEKSLEAANSLYEYITSHEDVVHTEVGAISKSTTQSLFQGKGPENIAEVDENGVWCRIYSNGSADYRYTTSLDVDNLENIADKAIRAAKHLGQNYPERIIPDVVHQATHNGWTPHNNGSNIIGKIESIVKNEINEIPHDRFRIKYRNESITNDILSSTGSTVHTETDRYALSIQITLEEQFTLRNHVASTNGSDILRCIEEGFCEIRQRANRIKPAPTTDLDSLPIDPMVLLSPAAAAQVFHKFIHLLEMDMVFIGASNLSIGDKVGTDELSIEDCVHAGTWSSLAYDAEATPTTPVELIRQGKVVNHLHSVSSAVEEDRAPSGHLIPGLSFEKPPQIHSRHLEIMPSNMPIDHLREAADVYIERFGRIRHTDEFTRRMRSSEIPGGILYAKDVGEHAEPASSKVERKHRVTCPVEEAYIIQDRDEKSVFEDAEMTIAIKDLKNIEGIGKHCYTLSGNCMKFGTYVPYEVSSPAVLMSGISFD